jgi:phosphoribosyl 1,2-cyclic phosphodiesterase
LLNVTFHGVRGSTPCSCDANRRYGGNTSCVSITVPGEDPLLLDIGTGLRFFGEGQPMDGTFRGNALVSHLHWDHVQGLPFCPPILMPGAGLRLFAPGQEDGRSVHSVFDEFMKPPYFPVRMEDLPSDIRFEDCEDGSFAVGDAKVLARSIPHVGRTMGYRVDWHGRSVAYLPDHQQPIDGSWSIAEGALELADGVDLLIHDAQYLAPEFEGMKRTWGHCTIEYAMHVAREAGAKQIALFHHDPVRSDDTIDEIVRCSQVFGDHNDIEVLAAAENVVVEL